MSIKTEPIAFEWSYKPVTSTGDYYGTQKDWNHTLLTKFNQMTADKYVQYDSKTDVLIVPRKYEYIIKSLEFYNEEKRVIESIIDYRPDLKVRFHDQGIISEIVLATNWGLTAKATLKINNIPKQELSLTDEQLAAAIESRMIVAVGKLMHEEPEGKVDIKYVRPDQLFGYLEELGWNISDEHDSNGWSWDFWRDAEYQGRYYTISTDGYYEKKISIRFNKDKTEEENED